MPLSCLLSAWQLPALRREAAAAASAASCRMAEAVVVTGNSVQLSIPAG